MKQILEDTLGLKGIQTSQVLDAQGELYKSVIFELIWALWYILAKQDSMYLNIQYNET